MTHSTRNDEGPSGEARKRFALAQVLSGEELAFHVTESGNEDIELVATAEREGVVALLATQLRRAGTSGTSDTERLGAAFEQALKEAACHAAMFSLVLEVETRRLLALMATSKIRGLLLKGQALARWAYEDPALRASRDVDVLVASRRDVEILARQLGDFGYAPSHLMPAELVGYELTCARLVSNAVSIEIDLHWRLSNSPLFGYRFTFDELMNESIALPGLGPNARGLGPVHALLHACMHRAFDLSEPGYHDSLKWLYDIPMMTRRFTANDWDHFATLCRQRGLAGVCLVSIDAASEAFGTKFLALPSSVRSELEKARAGESLDVGRLREWRYREYKVMMALPSILTRVRYLAQRLLPSRQYMTELYGVPDKGYLTLMGIRLYRAARRFLGKAV